MTFDRTTFPSGYERMAGGALGALDDLVPLEADLRPSSSSRGPFPNDAAVRFIGWAAVPVSAGRFAPPLAAFVTLGDSSVRLPATFGGERSDVARHLGDSRAGAIGFSGTATIGGARCGRTALSLVVVSPIRKMYHVLDLGRTIDVAESITKIPKLPATANVEISVRTFAAMHSVPTGVENTFFVGEHLVVRGDAVDRITGLGASRVFATVDNARCFGGITQLQNDGGTRTSFSIRFPTQQLRAGRHTLQITAVAPDLKSLAVAPAISFVLRRN